MAAVRIGLGSCWTVTAGAGPFGAGSTGAMGCIAMERCVLSCGRCGVPTGAIATDCRKGEGALQAAAFRTGAGLLDRSLGGVAASTEPGLCLEGDAVELHLIEDGVEETNTGLCCIAGEEALIDVGGTIGAPPYLVVRGPPRLLLSVRYDTGRLEKEGGLLVHVSSPAFVAASTFCTRDSTF